MKPENRQHLDALAQIVAEGQTIVANAESLTRQIERDLVQMKLDRRQADIDRLIDEADYIFKRGKYANLRPASSGETIEQAATRMGTKQ